MTSVTARFASTLRRPLSSSVHFYRNKQLELYASKETNRLTLRQLIFFGRNMNEDRIIKSANYVRTELPVRIAHRVRDMQALPYIVVTQDHVARVYELYWSAFDKLRQYPPISTLRDNERFCEFLRSLLDEHAAVIPALSLGLAISSPYLPPDDLDAFTKRMLVSRISRRVLAEHHIALSRDFVESNPHLQSRSDNKQRTAHVGIISTELDIARSIQRCVELLGARSERVLFAGESDGNGTGIRSEKPHCPPVVVDGHASTKFAYIRAHFEYIIFELLKNAMFATSLHHAGNGELPEIRATIAEGKDDVHVRISDQGGGLEGLRVASPKDLLSFSHVQKATRTDRVRMGALRNLSSRPEGLRATVEEQLARWEEENKLKDDPEKKAGVGAHTKLGIGLPMSNIFATYFGGSLELVSLDGWGTDAHLKLPKLGTKLEGIEV